MDTSTRLPGHSLWSEGWPVMATPGQGPGWRRGLHRGDIGRALCECGVMSEPLLSAAERKRWHREVHKTAVRAATSAPVAADSDREAVLDFAEFLRCKKETETHG